MFEQAESYRTLCLSTAHLTPKDAGYLRQLAEGLDRSGIVPKEGGWFLWTHEGDLDVFHDALYCAFGEGAEWSDALSKIVAAAHAEGFRYIDFDQDAPEVDGLPRYDW